MRSLRHPLLITGFLVFFLPGLAFSSTWVDIEVTCPVCGTANLFKAPASYGTYVYQDPSRFQYVFWPATTSFFLYTCRRCHLTAYMQDFDAIPEAKVEMLRAMLEREGNINGSVTPYHEIPVPTRLAIARQVYEILGRDAEFWCEFDRIAGYHFAESGEPQKAHEARRSALSAAEGLVENGGPETNKETFVILAAMRFFTGDISGAREALASAESLTFSGDGRDAKALDGYLTELIADFHTELLEGRAPR